MKKQRKYRELSDAEMRLVRDLTLPPDVVSMMIDMPRYYVMQIRWRDKFKNALRDASRRFRAKTKAENEERFGGAYRCYKFWSEDEINYLKESTETDEVIALKLHRTVASVQKKRQRIEEGK